MTQLDTPPYYVVIFTSQRTDVDQAGYSAAAEQMEELASRQPGFLGIESVRDVDGFGITVSYWADLAAIEAWKSQADHVGVQRVGRKRWYESYRLQVARVERAVEFPPSR
ncbi:antibiotic biosynthesis monooxygenase family protein [Blastopirellula marina]|uniref:Antibiotic biosynthesis monooxygenase n=1 Tax=Blastopirellula marina TaxID=124 RepID=A0A2S8GKS5_9BACT|nr:antibiotic biosynthesis monooxygenase [Blastopirellula marina]PQO45032.1 antibiotic biosynthesis monooxygenase [Blastopirellula marina]